jgi:hypothetical protein
LIPAPLQAATIGDANYLLGTQQGQILGRVLKQCGDGVSREHPEAGTQHPRPVASNKFTFCSKQQADSCVALCQSSPRRRDRIATFHIVPRPAPLRRHGVRTSIDREPSAGGAAEMTYEVLLCSFLLSIAR